MNLLSKIIQHKKEETHLRKAHYPLPYLEAHIHFDAPTLSLKDNILAKSGIIAEFKRKSPSRGDINKYASVEKITRGYAQTDVSGISVLTDQAFFGGSSQDMRTARKWNHCPLLRKDFIIDEYQVIESKAIGADAVLLIAAVLDAPALKRLVALSHDLGMEVLVELHDLDELKKIPPQADMIGVNSRNLNDFTVDLAHAVKWAARLPQDVIKIAESGISSVSDIEILHNGGYHGYLIGEFFMQATCPITACRRFITDCTHVTS